MAGGNIKVVVRGQQLLKWVLYSDCADPEQYGRSMAGRWIGEQDALYR